MRKFVVIALAMLFVFSCAAIAGAAAYPAGPAPFAGAQLINPERAEAPGYLAWESAMEQMEDFYGPLGNEAPEYNWVLDEDSYGNPHGGYVTATTKCAVCHSVHRAIPADFTGPGRTDITPMLTGAGSACLNCHGTDGSVSTKKPVEWPEIGSGDKSAHTSAGCVMCHSGSIHGNTTSKYFGMNIYLLGNSYGSDENIANEVAAGNISDRGFTRLFLMEKGTTEYNESSSAPNSWEPVKNASGNPAMTGEMAAIKANAAGFTCSRAGCHNTSMYSVNYWGYADWRQTDGSDLAGATGHRTTPGVGGYPMMGTLNQLRPAGANPSVAAPNNAACGPCHPGQVSGGYRGNATLPAGAEAATRSRAYGCDQCHDMIGAKSGTTAWPHANGGIPVIEWPLNTYDGMDDMLKPGYANPVVRAKNTAADGTNLWMYSGSALELGLSQDFMNWDSFAPNTAPAGTVLDGRFEVIKDAIGGSSNAGFAAGVTRDGACLKCHVPVDDKSLLATAVWASLNVSASTDFEASWRGVAKAGMHTSALTNSNPEPASFGAEPATAAAGALVFTYR